MVFGREDLGSGWALEDKNRTLCVCVYPGCSPEHGAILQPPSKLLSGFDCVSTSTPRGGSQAAEHSRSSESERADGRGSWWAACRDPRTRSEAEGGREPPTLPTTHTHTQLFPPVDRSEWSCWQGR